jgi:hypothetical protein
VIGFVVSLMVQAVILAVQLTILLLRVAISLTVALFAWIARAIDG